MQPLVDTQRATTAVVSRLEPALPAVDGSALWVRGVQRGPMVREVRGTGTLVPEEISWITSTSSGRVERIAPRPGAEVMPGTVILELSNPDLRESVRSAERDWQTAVAQLANQKATLTNTRFALRMAVLDAESAHALALTDLDLNKSLAETGLVASFTLRQKQALVDQARNRADLARQQFESTTANESLQLAPLRRHCQSAPRRLRPPGPSARRSPGQVDDEGPGAGGQCRGRTAGGHGHKPGACLES